MFKVYIIKSKSCNKYYIGHTKDIEVRLSQHNKGKVKSTRMGVHWELVYIEDFKIKSEAYRRELQIKSYKGGRAFENLINHK